MAKCTLKNGSSNHESSWTEKEWKDYVALRPELVAAARAVPVRPSQHDVDKFRTAVAASQAKRERDDSAEFRMMSRDMAREVIKAYTRGAKVIDLDTRRAPAVLRALGIEVDGISIDSVMPPPVRR